MDKKTFEERAMACERKLYGVAYLTLRSGQDCQDAVQEALYRAWAKKDALRDESLFETWLTRILINECKRILKSRARQAPMPDEGDLSGRSAEPDDPALRDAILALDMKYRLPVILYYVDGYKVAQVARILGIPQNTVKWRLSRARTILKDELIKKGVSE